MNQVEKKPIETILFEYLKDILYYPQKAFLNIEEIPENFQKLAKGLILLNQFVQDNTRFMNALAEGDLSVTPPSPDNPISASAKALHGALSHLVWQTKQVAIGDYSQRVLFLGEFADAFNFMTSELQKKEQLVEKEQEYIQLRTETLQQFQNIFLDLAATNKQHIVVTNSSSGEIFYSNIEKEKIIDKNLYQALKDHPVTPMTEPPRWEFKYTDDKGREVYLWISSYHMSWNGVTAEAHLISEITDIREKEKALSEFAYRDSLTNLYNRRYGLDVIQQYVKNGNPFIIAFCDMDYLKYCNDQFGHEEGDRYILGVSQFLSSMPIEKIVCRAGGDEFLVIVVDIQESILYAELEKVQKQVQQMPVPEHYCCMRNLSFGIAVYTQGESIEHLLSLADERMYVQKRKHKGFFEN